MKILFICSCLEKGFDGVGDYTRRLASAIIGKNNHAAVIALNDKYAKDTFTGAQQESGTIVPVLRLPATLSLNARLIEARNYINQFNPDWVSLQFVIFGYHPKGLPFGLGRQLAKLGRGRRWHLMFHELWIGMASESPVKQKYWGLLQKNIIKTLLLRLKPTVIHTHSTLYQAQLHKMGFKAGRLRLFGNIPVQNNQPTETTDPATKADKRFTLVIFGTIHPGAPIKQFAQEVAAYANREKVQVLLKIVGRSGLELNHWVDEWRSAGLSVEILGEQPVNIISKVLSEASVGISSSAYFMIEKSGTTAAMLEHGLPVICVSGPYTPTGIPNLSLDPYIFEYKPGNFREYSKKLKAPVIKDRLDEVANQLCLSLK